MVKYVEDQNEAGHDYTQDATTLWGTTGGTILKELHQFGQFISQRKYGSESETATRNAYLMDITYLPASLAQEFASYPPNVAGFAADIGCGIFPEGKSWDAEWAVTSINNADSYRTASEAMYWSGVFKLPTGTFPKPPQLYDFSNANLTSELPKLMSETRIFSHVTFPSPTSNDYITLPATVTEPAYSLTTLTPAWSCHSGSDLENQNPSLEDGGDWACTCSLGGALYGTLELGLIPAASWSGTECPTTSTDLPFLQATTVTTTETPTCTFSIE